MKPIKCLITGASTGIGRSTAIQLSKISEHIYIVARNVTELEVVHDNIIENDCKCTIVPLDLSEINGIENLSNEISKKEGYLDLLLLSAGKIANLSPVESINLSDLKNVIELNFISNFRLIKNFHSLLKNSKDPQLVLISSAKDEHKKNYWGVYQPVMSALNELVITYANENRHLNIKANILCPDSVDTKLRDHVMPGEDKSSIKSPTDAAKEIINFICNTKTTGKIIKF